MTVLDYIYLIALGAGIILGLWRGLVKQIFVLAGVVVIAVGTSYLSPLPTKWLQNAISSDTTRSIVGVAITFVVLTIVYSVVTTLISRLINKTPGLGKANRILGAVFAFAVVYLAFGFVTALVVQTSPDVMPSLKTVFGKSWIVSNIYGGAESPERNFFGNWLLKTLIEKIQSLAPDLAAA